MEFLTDVKEIIFLIFIVMAHIVILWFCAYGFIISYFMYKDKEKILDQSITLFIITLTIFLGGLCSLLHTIGF